MNREKEFIMNNIKKYSVVASAVLATLVSGGVNAQGANTSITNSGISPASNTYRSFNDSPLTRDRDIQNAFDLLQDFYPSIEIAYESHDNVRRRPGAQEKDDVIRIKPSLEYRTNLGRHNLYLSAAADSKKHDEFESEDVSSSNLRGALRIDVSKKIDLDLQASLLSTYEERGVSGTTGFVQSPDGPEEVDIDTLGADLRYGLGISRLNASVGVETKSAEYKRAAARGRDRDTDEIHLDVSYDVGASTSAFIRFEDRDIDYVTGDLDSDENSVLVGLRFKPTGKIDGVFGIGTKDKDFVSPAREDYDGSRHYVNLNYAVKPYSIVSLNASRNVEEPGEDLSDYYVSELLGLAWEHSLTDRLSFKVYKKNFEDDYNNGRLDEFDDSGINVSYAFRNWLTAGIQFGQVERESNRANVAYEDDYVGITLRSNLRRSPKSQ